MKKILILGFMLFFSFVLTGCKSNPNGYGPTIQYLIYQKISFTKASKALTAIPKRSKIFIVNPVKYGEHEGSHCINSLLLKYMYFNKQYPDINMLSMAKKMFKKDNYLISNKIEDSDYIIILEPTIFDYYENVKNRCSKNNISYYTKNFIKNFDERQHKIDINNSDNYLQNAISSLNLASAMNNAGYSNAANGMAALGVAVFLFHDRNPIVKITRVTVVNKKNRKIETTVFTTNAAGSYSNSKGAVISYQTHEINKLLMLID